MKRFLILLLLALPLWPAVAQRAGEFRAALTLGIPAPRSGISLRYYLADGVGIGAHGHLLFLGPHGPISLGGGPSLDWHPAPDGPLYTTVAYTVTLFARPDLDARRRDLGIAVGAQMHAGADYRTVAVGVNVMLNRTRRVPRPFGILVDGPTAGPRLGPYFEASLGKRELPAPR
ncbi:MAG TPA: hypothetical protein VD948_02060 [Rhodothermales bacterium]|nr:hypothetical protein [Rhodothermales bacterium]